MGEGDKWTIAAVKLEKGMVSRSLDLSRMGGIKKIKIIIIIKKKRMGGRGGICEHQVQLLDNM